MRFRTFAPTAFVAALVFTMSLALGAPAVSGQEATPGTGGTPEPGGQATPVRHPAHIHMGTCEELGSILYPLNGVTAGGAAATPVAADGTVDVMAQSTTEVDASLDELLAEDFAINVHKSREQLETYIACGDITGTPENGELAVQLHELNDSGFTGEAMLVDQGDGTTVVHVRLVPADVSGTPAATPAS